MSAQTELSAKQGRLEKQLDVSKIILFTWKKLASYHAAARTYSETRQMLVHRDNQD